MQSSRVYFYTLFFAAQFLRKTILECVLPEISEKNIIFEAKDDYRFSQGQRFLNNDENITVYCEQNKHQLLCDKGIFVRLNNHTEKVNINTLCNGFKKIYIYIIYRQ